MRFQLALLLAVLPGASFGADAALEERVQRIAFTLNIAGEEYAEGVSDGRVVNAGEYEEATMFVAQARAQYDRAAAAQGLDAFDRDGIDESLAALAADIAAKRGSAGVIGRIQALNISLGRAFGVSTLPVPTRRPSAAAGARIFTQNCAMCHGAHGDGKGPAAPGLRPAPAAFNDAAKMRTESPLMLFSVVTVGVGGTGMISWADRLSEIERWDVVAYLKSFTASSDQVARGRALAQETELPAAWADLEYWVAHSDAELDADLAAADPQRAAADRAALIAYLRLGDDFNDAPASRRRGPDVAAVAAKVARTVERALEHADAGAVDDAADTALEAYLHYEAIETRMALEAPEVNARLEAAFPRLRSQLARGAKRAEVADLLSGIRSDLHRLPAGAPTTPWALFLQALLIILREGFEAILILGAIAAYLKRIGHADKLKVFYRGAAAGVAASLATAWALDRLFAASKIGQETLEGLVMLTAAAVLFYVSFWLLQKVEVKRWNAFIRGRLKTALSGGSLFALASVAFLAVYREGFETVLFYKALLGFSEAGALPVAAGFGVGCCGLAALFVGFDRVGGRIPVKEYFIGTSVLLYAMAFSFMGQGIAELQEAGWLSATEVPWAPTLAWAGVYPTLETLGGQMLLVLAAAAGLVYAFLIEPARARGSSAAPLHKALKSLQGAREVVEKRTAGNQPLNGSLETLVATTSKLEAELRRFLEKIR